MDSLLPWLLGGMIFWVLYSAMGNFSELRAKNRSSWKIRSEHVPMKALREADRLGARVPFNKFILQNKRFRDRMELLLLRSGQVFGWTPADALLCKEVMILVALILCWGLNVESWLYWGMAAVVGFWLPDYYLKIRITARQSEMRRQLPGFIDLLALTMESGLDLVAAIERILEKMRPNAWKQELQTFLQESRLGTPRKEALQHLAHRTDVNDVQSLTSLIIQSEELGTSLASVLRNHAEDMRTKRITTAEEVAGKAPVKLLFPMMVFFFPIVFVIIFGPLAISFLGNSK